MGRMGERLRAFFGGGPKTFQAAPVVRFSTGPVLPVDQLLSRLYRGVGRVGREEALTVPAVLRGRNMICSISTLPLEAVGADNRVRSRPLFQQLDPNVPNVVMVAMTLEDLLFDAVAWWRVTGFDDEGMPSRVRRYAPDQVNLQQPDDYQHGYLPSGLPTNGVVWMEGHPVPFSEVIRFDSPNPALLTSAVDTVRRAIALDQAAELYAANPRRRGFFAPKDGVDPDDDDKIIEALDAWQDASTKRVDGYVPAALDYTSLQDSTPLELQLVQMQQRVSLDLANALGIDPEDLGINTTSRTYQNATDRRQDRINETLAPYMRAITDRLAMPDVTREGTTVRFALGGYLRADPKTRAEVQAIYAGLGATDPAEIREDEGRPARTIAVPAVAAPSAAVPGEPRRVPSSTAAQLMIEHHAATFAATTATFDATVQAADVDLERRTITGLAVPWNQTARSGGRNYRFARGGVKWASVNRVKLLRDHDNSQAIGKAISLVDTDAGLMATFKVSPGRQGDEALALALDGVLDGLSIGVEFRVEDTVRDPENPGAFLVHEAALRETSLTAMPAFDDSRLTSVRATQQREDLGMTDVDTTTDAVTPPAAEPAPVTFSADQFAQFLETVRQPAAAAPAARPTVDPTAGRPAAATVVREPLPYNFTYTAEGRFAFAHDAKHDFSTDVYKIVSGGAGAGEVDRVNALIKAQFSPDMQRAKFDVDRADTVALNPNKYRPELWQPQMDYNTPLWDMISAGPTDGTPFDIPKFNSSSGLVGPATEGTEPAAGAMTVTSQTITPTQVWGKVEVTRQAARRGGRPELSGILWEQMLREYYEDRESAVATFLNTLTAAADITVTGTPAATPDNDDDQASAQSLEAAIALLQFVRGGNRFRAFAVHQNLYKVLARVTDDAGRPLYPMLNPMNANGTAANLFGTLNVAGTTAVPSWALGADSGTAAANSWLFDPAKVLGWASAPERLDWNFGATVQTANIPQLSHVTIGIYGDIALGNLDINGVRQVIFDPSV